MKPQTGVSETVPVSLARGPTSDTVHPSRIQAPVLGLQSRFVPVL